MAPLDTSASEADRTRDHCQAARLGWAFLLVGVSALVAVTVLALAGRADVAAALGAVPAATLSAGAVMIRR